MYTNKTFRIFLTLLLSIFISLSLLTISHVQAGVQADTSSSSTLSPAIIVKLDAFIMKIQILRSKYSSDADWKKFLTNLNLKIFALKSQYVGNSLILAVLDRLTVGVNELKDQGALTISPITTTDNIVINSVSCVNKLVFWNLEICDTGTWATYATMNNLCPSWFHVPGYWEMYYIIDSWITLTLKWTEYYIANLYWDIVNSPGYPFNGNPYVFDSRTKKMNFKTDVGNSWISYWISNVKRNVMCINNSANIPTSSNVSASCKIENNLYSTWVVWSYVMGKEDRKYLFEWENFSLFSPKTDTNKWNLDYSLIFSCKDWTLVLTEKIEKANSCKYGYNLVGSDCVVDPTVCNMENLWNFHSVNSKVCSWKDIWTEEIIDKNVFSWNSLWSKEQAKEMINNWDTKTKQEYYNLYRTKYNNKIDIQVNCTSKKIGTYTYTLNYLCNIKWLFWQ